MKLAESEMQLVASALQEYSKACELGAEMAAGRNEERRFEYLRQAGQAQLLLERIDCAA